MKNVSTLAVGALALSAVSATALAVPEFFDINVQTTGAFFEGADVIGHEFGTVDVVQPFPNLFISFESGLSDRPGWAYQMVVDYSLYAIEDFGPNGASTVNLLGIKAPDSPFPISGAHAKDAFGNEIGSIVFDGGNITWFGNVPAILKGGEIVTIQWNQIPAPGAIALLGLAGLAGGRRRR